MKKLYTSDKFFLAVTVIAIVCEVVSCLINIFVSPAKVLNNMLQMAVIACIIVLYVSYKRHNKNLMKGMMGALVMAFVMIEIMSLSSIETQADLIATVIALVLAIVIFINHFVINSSRNPSPVQIQINQKAGILYALTYIIWMFTWIGGITDVWMIISSVVYVIAIPCMMADIVCIESRLDAYRTDREEAGWTKENGYPEGYVHEYEKKDK